jgi:hypothetical protein
MTGEMNTERLHFCKVLRSIVLGLLLLVASLPSTSQVTLTQRQKSAILALEQSEEQMTLLYVSMYNLWENKQQECEYLREQLRLCDSSDEAKSENYKIIEAQLKQAKADFDKADQELEKMMRRRKIGKVMNKVITSVSFGLGLYLGIRLF